MEWIFSLDKINDIARQCWRQIGDQKVIVLHGQMGAGKTTLVHALCHQKGVKDVVGSPTFSIINEYVFKENDKNRTIFHIDLYRLKDEAEAIQAGVEDCLYSGQVCFVEWPEKAPGIFPTGTFHLHLTTLDTQTRKLKIANI